MEVKKIKSDSMAEVSLGGVSKEISLELLEDAIEVGDYVIVHAGFAIAKIGGREAQVTLSLLKEGFSDALFR